MNRCPNSGHLKAFAVGELIQEELHEIADHLQHCDRCNQRIRSFDDYTDELISTLASMPYVDGQDEDGQSTIDASRRRDFAGTNSAIYSDPGEILAARLQQGELLIDKFVLRSKLGTGSFGHVFLAHDTELDRDVAIKIHRFAHDRGTAEIQRFIREAKNAARLQHPSIVSIYETGQTEDGIYYLVNEYVPGETLQTKIRNQSISLNEGLGYLTQLADALQDAHLHGIVHRDVKPSNIIIDPAGRVHLTDFGLAKSTAADDTMTGAGQVMGTPAYMSPEQASGRSVEVDARSDIYSLGVVMYEILTSQQPFQGKSRLLLLQVLEDDPRPPSQLNETIPRDLETICLKALSKLPRLRYQTAAEFADDLRRFENGEPIQARPIGYAGRFARWCRRYPAAVVAFLTLIIGSISAIVYLSLVSQYLVQQTARASAEMQAGMLDAMNEYYSGLVKKMDIHLQESGHLEALRDLEQVRPVPARFTIELGRQLQAAKQPGLNIRLYSDHPFPSRPDGGPPDEFARRALDHLDARPDDPLVEFTELENVPVVRFATARVMTESCVDCHNNHPDTPKNDWAVGDVRGVLEIIRPLEKDVQRTRQGMGNAIGWIITITAMMFVFVAAIVFATTKKN